MGTRRIVAVIALGLLAAGCSDGELDADGPVGSQGEEIIGGSLDTNHQWVVAYLVGGSKCSATIVAKNGSNGYALTAGHCIKSQMGVIRQGDNHNSGYIEYPVVEKATHPEYGSAPLYDVAMLRFSGATVNTPAFAALTAQQDNLNDGASMKLLGYGQTQNSGGGTSRRHIVVKPIANATSMRLVYDQATNGICSGDSGGPSMLSTSNNVAGVHSTVGGGQCVGSNSIGTDIRVSAVESTFIQPFINNTAYGMQTCDQCVEAHTYNDGGCWNTVLGCLNNTACSNYITCLQGCSTQTCANQCAYNNQGGYQQYLGIYTCACDNECTAECSGDPTCDPPAYCGLTSGDTDCQQCWENNCCSEAFDCANDSFCLQCINSSTPSSNCASDPEVSAFIGCLDTSCDPQCNISIGTGSTTATSTGVGGSSGVGGAGGAGAVVSTGVGANDPSTSSGNPAEDDGELIVENGCGCTTPGRRGGNRAAALLALLLGIVGLRRRRVL